MAFSTLRKYSTQHSMSPSVAPSKGSGGGAPSGGSAPAGGAGGSPASDNAALAGMGAVGAGLLGKFAYDKSKQDLIDKATAEATLAANPNNDIMGSALGTNMTDTYGDVMGGLGDASQGVVMDPLADSIKQPGKLETIANIPSTMGNGITNYWDAMKGWF